VQERRGAFETAYRQGYMRGAAKACDNALAAVERQGEHDGLAGRQPQPPAMTGCPAEGRGQFEAAYARGFDSGLAQACQDELAAVRRQGERDGSSGNPQNLPPMRRCPAEDSGKFQAAYLEGHAAAKQRAAKLPAPQNLRVAVDGDATARKPCQEELAAVRQQGERDGALGNNQVFSFPHQCVAELGNAFVDAYQAGYAAGRARALAACPDTNQAFEQGRRDGLSGSPSRGIATGRDCVGRYRDAVGQAYTAGFEEGRRSTQAKPSLKATLVGRYENHKYDAGGKNDWHYVTVTDAGDDRLTWSNRAKVSWTLQMTSDRSLLTVGSDCPYYSGGHTAVTVDWNNDGTVKRLRGPGGEWYDRESR
jgi:hypothetical protein